MAITKTFNCLEISLLEECILSVFSHFREKVYSTQNCNYNSKSQNSLNISWRPILSHLRIKLQFTLSSVIYILQLQKIGTTAH